MTMEMAEVVEIEVLPPVTQCLLCQQEFTNPRVLNCVHTFCLKCLTKYSENERKQPGQRLPCPVCQKDFVIPDGGIEDLSKNIFMEHLLEIRRLEKADSKEIPCQVCDPDEDAPFHALGSNRATTYCLDCRQYHCSRCSKHHTKQRFSTAHEMVELGKEISKEMIKRVKTYCDQHKDKQVEFYCYDCRVTFCMSCYVVRHNNHKSCDIAEISAQFYSNVEEDIGRVIKITGECQKEAEYLETLETKFVDDVEAVKKRIKRDADKLRKFLDEEELKLLDDLTKIKKTNMECIKNRMHDICQHISMLNNFKQYITEVREKATPADVSRIGCSLHDRANELHAIPYDVDFVLDTIRYESEDFAQKYRSNDQSKNLIGCVSVMRQAIEGKVNSVHQNEVVKNEDEMPSSQPLANASSSAEVIEIKAEPIDADSEQPSTSMQSPKSQKSGSLLKVVRNVVKGAPIQGITAMNGELFVVRKPENVASALAPWVDVEVYDLATYACSHRIHVPGLLYPWDMASCASFTCLYISDSGLRSIHKIQLVNSVQKKWAVDDQPGCLSVNRTLNVLVTCTQSHLIKEYRTDGTLIREISLAQRDLNVPHHVVQLESGLLVICHGSGSPPNHQVCITDIDGNVMESFGGSEAAKVNQLCRPSYVTVFRSEYIFVADSGNRRILLLTSNLVRAGVVLSKSEMLRNPFRMLLVDDTLYVVDNSQTDGQVLVCDYQK